MKLKIDQQNYPVKDGRKEGGRGEGIKEGGREGGRQKEVGGRKENWRTEIQGHGKQYQDMEQKRICQEIMVKIFPCLVEVKYTD